MTIAQGGGMTVLTRVVFHGKNHWDVKKNRAGNTLLSHFWTHVVYCREVEKWTRSRLNPWQKLAFEILRQAGASLLLAALSSFFAFVVVYLALFCAQFFCVLPYDHSMRCNCLSRTIFCL